MNKDYIDDRDNMYYQKLLSKIEKLEKRIKELEEKEAQNKK